MREPWAKLNAEQRDSLGVLLMIANDQSVPFDLRIKAASEAAERQYPRLSANVTNRVGAGLLSGWAALRPRGGGGGCS